MSCKSRSQERPYQAVTDRLEAAKLPDRPNELELSWERAVLKNFRAHSYRLAMKC